MHRWRKLLTPAVWVFYVAIVLEILFMISPFALYFYSLYGPTLNVLHLSPWTSWLTGFFLPHFSATTSPALGYLKAVAGILILAGVIGFVLSFIQIYWAKLLRKGAVTSGFYRVVRHPQYVALAILGLGTLVLWPRFTVLLMYVTMLFLYSYLARHEEELCLQHYGDDYRSYHNRTGRFLPRRVERYLPGSTRSRGALSRLGVWLALAALAVGLGYLLRDYSLSQVAGFYEERAAVLSPAPLSHEQLTRAWAVAQTAQAVEATLDQDLTARFVAYVLPESWYLADLPAEPYRSGTGGHQTPADFDPEQLKVLLTRARTHFPASTGVDIVRHAYGREPLFLVHVDLGEPEVRSIETPPAHVVWGDIPTPMF
jgi:protein-S-isoprenylcysteine O-methyltransferase Ste14